MWPGSWNDSCGGRQCGTARDCWRRGSYPNHVHAIVQLPPIIDIPRLVQGLKGASARIANRDGLMPRARLRWADGYDLRSVGVRQLPNAVRYVSTQAEHHPDLAIRPSGPHRAERPLRGRNTRAEARARRVVVLKDAAGWLPGARFHSRLVSTPPARVAKLVDARDLKSLGGNPMQVRVLPRALRYGRQCGECSYVPSMWVRRAWPLPSAFIT